MPQLHTNFGARLRAMLALLLIAGYAAPALAKAHKAATSKHAPAEEAQPAPAPTPAPAAEPAPAPQAAEPLDPKQAELKAAFDSGMAIAIKGPGKAPLVDQADLVIGDGEIFVPAEQSLRILRALGNSPEKEGLMGLVLSVKDDANWMVVVRYIKEGYVKDDDAKSWSADDLLSSLSEGTEEANKDRQLRGFPEVEIVGWVEKPAYDAATKRLVWSILSKQKGASESDVQGVNYNTYALGRDGYFSLNLLTDANQVESHKPIAKALLGNLAYRAGKRYEDFNASTDQIAAYGLAALVGGVAAKKLGLLALGAAFFAKFAKLIVVGVIAAGAGAAKFFKKNSGNDAG